MKIRITALRHLLAWSLLMLAISFCPAASLTAQALPTAQFSSWMQLEQIVSDSVICQIWRKPISDLPKGATGYVMVSYQVKQIGSPNELDRTVKSLLQKEQFNDLVGKGFTITMLPWDISGKQGALFAIKGLATNSAGSARAQYADVYSLAFSRGNFMIWLQVRQSCTVAELSDIKQVLKHSDGPQIANSVANTVLDIWHAKPVIPSATPPVSANPSPVTVTRPAENNIEPAPIAPTITPAQTTPTVSVPTPAVPAVSTPTTPTKPVLVTPPPPETGRWQTTDGYLSLVLPTGWKVQPKTPSIITGAPNCTISLYPFDTYSDEAGRDRAITGFVSTMRNIAALNFQQQSCTINDATGVLVSYTNHSKHMVYSYYLAKSGRLWRLNVELTQAKAPLPGAVRTMMESLRLQ